MDLALISLTTPPRLSEGFAIVREPPAIAVHALVDGQVVSHVPPV